MSELEEEPLQTTPALMATGFTMMFSDSLNNRFNNILVAASGATVNQMGFLQGAKSLSGNLLQLLFGRLVDRYGKKRFIAAGRLLNAGAIAALLVFDAPMPLIWLVILSSFFYSMTAPSWSSLLGDYTTDRTRGVTIGLINSVSQMGSFFAMIIAFALSITDQGETTVESFTLVLALAAATSLLGGVLVLFTKEKPPRGTSQRLELSRLVKDPRLTRYLLLNFVYGVGMSFAWPLFPLVITHRLRMKVWQISTLSITSSLVSTLTQRRLGAFMDRIGRRPIIVMSRVSMAVAPVAYALATQWWHIALAELFLGLGMAAWMSSESTYVIDLAPGDLRATYLASSTTAFGVACFLGSNVSGRVIDAYLGGLEGLSTGLYFSAALRLVFGLAYLTAHESVKRGQE
jgi:DHA1 family multidrug resistance protein-like MFS transporter